MTPILGIEHGQGYIAKIETHSFVDGEGVRCSVYVSGCLFQCLDCYNKAAQHFKYGEPFTEKYYKRFSHIVNRVILVA